MANPKMVVNDRYATKVVKSMLVRSDHLVEYIRKTNAENNAVKISEKEMYTRAKNLLSLDQPNPVDYTQKYQLAASDKEKGKQPKDENNIPICPICGGKMVKRISRQGSHAGEYFYGCSNYPKCRGLISQKVYEDTYDTGR